MTAPVRPKMTFDVATRRVDAHGSLASCKGATIPLDTDLAGRLDAFNPAELLLAALSACMNKGIERVTPIMKCSAARLPLPPAAALPDPRPPRTDLPDRRGEGKARLFDLPRRLGAMNLPQRRRHLAQRVVQVAGQDVVA